MNTTITDGYLDALLSAAETTEKILSGDRSEFERLLNEGQIKRINGKWRGPSHGMDDMEIVSVTPADYADYAWQLGTAFFLIGEISQIKEMEPPMKVAATRLRERISAAMESGETLILSEEETISASKVLEFTVRMCLGQLERITDAFRDAQDDNLDRFAQSVSRIEAAVNKLKNALGYPDNGNIGIHSSGKFGTWKMVEHLRTGPKVVIPPTDLLEYSGFNS